MPTARISQIQLTMVPSADPDRSVAFYEALGFEKRGDWPMASGDRWVEVYLPGDSTGIALVPPRPQDAGGVQTGIILNTKAIDALHDELIAAGLDVDAEIGRPGGAVAVAIGGVSVVGPTPPMFYVRDPDGNALLVVEAP